ncbi:MAG TPA: gliding motility-associated C-terminal domain-containing protein [Chryseolinea sp.]|nr:gliding motility-associated C-terminal domain-containing protein [Chryseolinea sp.]
MNKALIIVGFLGLANMSYAQLVSTSGSQLSTTAGTEIAIKTTGNVSIAQDLPSAKIDLELNGSSQTISENLTLRKLILTGSGIKTISKNLTVTDNIDFVLGILRAASSGKILYTGLIDGINEGNDNAYVDGFFFNQSANAQIFPVGAAGLGYAPATLLTGDNQRQVGMQVVNQSPNFVADPASDVKILENTHYWEVIAPSIADIDSKIELSLNGVDLIPDKGLSFTVVQADNIGDVVDGIGGSSSTASVTSNKVFTKALLGIGASEKVVVSVIDIITPKLDDHNDFLRVLNIEKFDNNKVKLLDRYGFVIKEWTDFKNYVGDDPNTDGFDFNTLSSGSYICVVEYGNDDSGMQSIQQMVSVIKN